MTVKRAGDPLTPELTALIAEELNVKEVASDASLPTDVVLDTTITPELKREGLVRELTRAVNDLRKRMGLTPNDRIRVMYETDDAELTQAITEHRNHLAQSTTATEWSERGASGASEEPAHHTLRIISTQITLDIVREV